MRRVATSKVMRKFLISLPKAVREALDVKPGEYIDWYIENDKIVVVKRRSEKE